MIIKTLKNNPNNPRTLSDIDFKKLLNKILVFPKLLEKNQITHDSDNDNIVLGGNMRLLTLNYIIDTYSDKDISKAIKTAQKALGIDNKDLLNESINIFSDVIDSKAIPNEWTQDAKGLSNDEKNAFILIDNVSDGKWNFDDLANEWEYDLIEWNIQIPTSKNTELLSKLEYESIYYEPKNKPNIDLNECINLNKFKAKLAIINNSNLSKKQKELFKIFAYRFIKIDFENVANYYYFNANEDEQKIIERLRLVLTDDGVDGFIEDDLLKIYSYFDTDD